MPSASCAWIAREDVFEGYVRDSLDPGERDAFEAHYFECDACYRRLKVYQGVRAELAEAPAQAPATAGRPAGRAWWWVALPLAAGLAIVTAMVMWRYQQSAPAPTSTIAVAPTQPAPLASVPAAPTPTPGAPVRPSPAPAAPSPAAPIPSLVELARVAPPDYLAPTLRAAPDEARERFDAAMRQYVKGDFAGAIPGLRAATNLRTDAPQYTFFLAACELLTNQTEAAASGFDRVIAAGDSPYLEEAHFYLAKTRLRQGNLAAARDELTRTIERRGRLEAEARRLLAQVNAHLAAAKGEDGNRGTGERRELEK